MLKRCFSADKAGFNVIGNFRFVMQTNSIVLLDSLPIFLDIGSQNELGGVRIDEAAIMILISATTLSYSQRI